MKIWRVAKGYLATAYLSINQLLIFAGLKSHFKSYKGITLCAGLTFNECVYSVDMYWQCSKCYKNVAGIRWADV